jgi:hypothetical protein
MVKKDIPMLFSTVSFLGGKNIQKPASNIKKSQGMPVYTKKHTCGLA